MEEEFMDELTTADVARIACVSVSTVLQWARKGILTTSRITGGGHYRYARRDVTTALETRRRVHKERIRGRRASTGCKTHATETVA